MQKFDYEYVVDQCDRNVKHIASSKFLNLLKNVTYLGMSFFPFAVPVYVVGLICEQISDKTIFNGNYGVINEELFSYEEENVYKNIGLKGKTDKLEILKQESSNVQDLNRTKQIVSDGDFRNKAYNTLFYLACLCNSALAFRTYKLSPFCALAGLGCIVANHYDDYVLVRNENLRTRAVILANE